MTQTMTAATAKRASHKTQHVRSAGDWVTLVLLVVAALIVLFPLLVLTVNAFKTQSTIRSRPTESAENFTMEGIVSFWTTTKFSMKFLNSLIISLTVAVAAVVLSVLNSFALGIGRVKGNTWIVLAIMLANMMPQEALLYAVHHVKPPAVQHEARDHHHLHHHPKRVRHLPALLRVRHVPAGHPRGRIHRRRLPLAGAAQGGAADLLAHHQRAVRVLLRLDVERYMIPMAFLMGDDVQTIPLALATLQGQHTMEATTLASASLLSIIPTIIFFVIFQRSTPKASPPVP